MKSKFSYRVIVEWSDEDGAFIARVPAIDGCSAHGKTMEVAAREVAVAANAMLEVMAEDGEVPPPSDLAVDYSGKIVLRIPPSLHRDLSTSAKAEGVSLNQFMIHRLTHENLPRTNKTAVGTNSRR